MLITLFIGDLDMKKIMTGTAENHVAFSRRIAAVFPTLDARYEMIERAYNTAKDSFRGVMRDGGERYFEHLREVTLILTDHLRVRDHQLIVAALLHDMVEDVPFWSVERIEREFGRDIAVLVEWVTKPPQGSFPDKDARDHAYHARLLEAPRDVAILKLADPFTLRRGEAFLEDTSGDFCIHSWPVIIALFAQASTLGDPTE